MFKHYRKYIILLEYILLVHQYFISTLNHNIKDIRVKILGWEVKTMMDFLYLIEHGRL